MKHIIKSNEPVELQEWFDGQPIFEGRRINCRYPDIDLITKGLIQKALLADQGGLCCYTGIRITKETSHIEHFKPQTLSKRLGDHDDVSYINMFAAYPENEPGKKRCSFGAEVKGGWYEPNNLINPLDEQCEQRFTYAYSGDMRPTMSTDEAAQEMISRLKLNDGKLKELRSARIDTFLFAEDIELTIEYLEMLKIAMDQRGEEGLFLEFCFVIKNICSNLLQRDE